LPGIATSSVHTLPLVTPRIDQLDTRSEPEHVLRELAGYVDMVEAEDMPGEPSTPFEMRMADWRHVPPTRPTPRWVLRDGDDIVGVGVASYDLEQNLDNGFGRLHVHPDHRGRGHARRLAKAVLDHLESQGRRRVDTWIDDGSPSEALADRLGLRRVLSERRSRLRVDDLDRDLMRTWIERARERASDYRHLYAAVPFPEEMVQDFCDLAAIMNTAPQEDFQAEDEILTVEAWREVEHWIVESRSQLHSLIAVHEPSGAFAGFTQLRTQDLQPDLAWQWDTGVHPDHRNQGLGRWLKAAMIERIVREHPEVTRVDTFNAGSNRPMLDINISMGFRPIRQVSSWQGELSLVRERLGV
jgi:mycothiol synthase